MRWQRIHFEYKETIVSFLCKGTYADIGKRSLVDSRKLLEAYIGKDPVFRQTHENHRPLKDSPTIVKRMCLESAKVDVGPMAAVAGTLVDEALRAMIQSGVEDVVIDNGGDIGCFVKDDVMVGIFTGESSIRNLALLIKPKKRPIGICTSSGTVGHSFSYGRANAALVVSHNIPLADAAATALGNRVNESKDLEGCFDFLKSLHEIEGAMVIINEKVALWGQLPEIIRSHVHADLITRGR